MKYAFIQSQANCYGINRLCQAMRVSSSGYYAWVTRPESRRRRHNRRLLCKISCFHQASRGTYGSPRIHKDLLESGEQVGINRVARLMQRARIQSRMHKRFVITTDSKNTMQAAPDRLQRQFKPSTPNRAWVSDTTFIPTRQGWLYLAVVIELYSRQVIGWAMGERNNTKLVSDALTMAIWRRGKAKDVIVHSDQGSTYASGEYQKLISASGLVCSMSRKGECLDNAVAESFFGSLKTEWVEQMDYQSRALAKQSLFEYIEVFYNRQRRHSYLDYLTPVEYEQKYASY